MCYSNVLFRKTSMLRHMAHHLALPSIVELHIDDQMDIKTLLGTYICRLINIFVLYSIR